MRGNKLRQSKNKTFNKRSYNSHTPKIQYENVRVPFDYTLLLVTVESNVFEGLEAATKCEEINWINL